MVLACWKQTSFSPGPPAMHPQAQLVPYPWDLLLQNKIILNEKIQGSPTEYWYRVMMRHTLGRTGSLHKSASTFSLLSMRSAHPAVVPDFSFFFSDDSVLTLRTPLDDLFCMTQSQYSRCFSFCCFPGSLNAFHDHSEAWVGQELEMQKYLMSILGRTERLKGLLAPVHCCSLHQEINGSDTSEKQAFCKKSGDPSLLCPE